MKKIIKISDNYYLMQLLSDLNKRFTLYWTPNKNEAKVFTDMSMLNLAIALCNSESITIQLEDIN